MEDAVLDLQKRGIRIAFTDLHGQPLEMFKQFNLVPGLVSEKYCFKDFKSCAEWLVGYCEYKGPEGKKLDVVKTLIT